MHQAPDVIAYVCVDSVNDAKVLDFCFDNVARKDVYVISSVRPAVFVPETDSMAYLVGSMADAEALRAHG